MGYWIQTFIGKLSDLEKISKSFSNSTITELKQSLALILLTEELYNEISKQQPSTHVKGFEYLTDNIEKGILNVIEDSTIGYIEADYFGGEGSQAGIIWRSGKRIFEKHGDCIINEVARYFDAKAEEGKDEFDTLGFGLIESDRSWDAY
jgi:hypothetical protein